MLALFLGVLEVWYVVDFRGVYDHLAHIGENLDRFFTEDILR